MEFRGFLAFQGPSKPETDLQSGEKYGGNNGAIRTRKYLARGRTAVAHLV